MANAAIVHDNFHHVFLSQLDAFHESASWLLGSLRTMPTVEHCISLWISKIERAIDRVACVTGRRTLIDCHICAEENVSPVALPCGHGMCVTCSVKHFMENSKNGLRSSATCPMCRTQYKLRSVLAKLYQDAAFVHASNGSSSSSSSSSSNLRRSSRLANKRARII